MWDEKDENIGKMGKWVNLNEMFSEKWNCLLRFYKCCDILLGNTDGNQLTRWHKPARKKPSKMSMSSLSRSLLLSGILASSIFYFLASCLFTFSFCLQCSLQWSPPDVLLSGILHPSQLSVISTPPAKTMPSSTGEHSDFIIHDMVVIVICENTVD